MRWRLVYLGERDPYECASYYDAFPTALKRGLIPNSLYVYHFSEPTVLMGRGSKPSIKHGFCLERGVVLVMVPRTSSAPTFWDKSQFLCFAIFSPVEKRSTREETTRFQRGIVNTLSVLGLKANMKQGRNDVLVYGKKISQIAPPKHGDVKFNFINDFDFDTAERAIVPKHDMRESMTTLKAELGREVTSEELFDALRRGFEPVLDAEFGDIEYELTEAEKEIVAGLREKYASEEWIRRGKWSPVRDYWRPK